MTETHATDRPTARTSPAAFPPGRYGRRRQPRRSSRWLSVLLAAALAAALGLVTVRLYQRYGDPNYRAEVITYTDITDSQVVITFRVTVPTGGAAACVLRARSRDGAEVGRETIVIKATPGDQHPTLRHRLATTARPMVGEVMRCRPAG